MKQVFELRIRNIRAFGYRVNHRNWLHQIGLQETWYILWTAEYNGK